jgi:predicted ATPase/class 3 adenylate cyclase/DNA-binding NarL/FixJ family response regulator
MSRLQVPLQERGLGMDGPPGFDRRQSPPKLVRTVPPFVGRRQELDWLTHRLQQAITGQPRIVLIPGEAGVGKTRLLQEVRSAAQRRRIQACYGRCYEDLSLPYLPFVEALRVLLEQAPEDVTSAPGTAAEILSRFLYGDATTNPHAPLSTSAQSDQDRLRLFLAVSEVTIALAQHCPTVIIVDDLHWADRSSLDLFSHLAFTVADTAMRGEPVPLLLIAIYRPVEPETPLSRLIARLQREPICETFAVSGLTESEIQELIQGLGLVRPSNQLIATVHEATQGNPLFIQEVIHHLVQQDALQERGGYVVTTATPADLPLPDQVTGAILSRLQGLSQGCRRALTLAACLGDRFSLEAVAAVSDVGEEAVLILLEEGMRQRLLLSEGQSFQFTHPLIRHVFYHESSAPRRQRMHAQIAATLQQLYADNLEPHILEIAHHFVRAGPAADLATVVRYARWAGDQAFAVFAWSEAARYYEATLSAAESTGRLSAQERAELHYRAGLARFRDQDVGPCLEHYEQAIEAYRLAGDMRGLARALMGKTRTRYRSSSYGALLDVQPLADVLDAMGDGEPGLQGSILAILSQAYRVAKQTDRAEEMAQRALEIGQRLGDDRLWAEASFALGLVQAQSLRVRETLESWQQALEHARRADDLWLQVLPLTRMPHILISLARLDEAEAVALQAYELIRQTQDWGDYSLSLSSLAFVAVARGDFAAAERRAHEAMQMMVRSRYPWGGSRALFALACARALRGAWDEAEDVLDMLVEPGSVFAQPGPIVQAFARTFRQLLRVYADAVEEATEPFGAELMRAVGIDSYALAPFCALVELGDLLSSPAMAEYPYQVLSVGAERGVLFSSANGWVFMLPRVLGVAATLNRWWSTAEAHFQRAIELAARVGASPELGRSYLDYAHMLAARGRKNDRRRAVEFVKQADAIFRKLGMEPFVRRTAQLAEGLHTRISPASRRRPASAANLSAREVEVLLQMAQGRTDREIADALVLSFRTVTRCVGTIFAKIGVNSRTAAAAYALAKGLVTPTPAGSVPETAVSTHRVVGRGKAPPQDIAPQLAESLLILLVSDMQGSTALIQRLGDARAHELIRLHNDIIREALHRHHGSEVTHTGDGIVASFAAASSAIECAMAIQMAFTQHNQTHPAQTLRVRIGLNAGEPIPTEGSLFGTAVHAAFRICARAQPGQILVSDVVRQLAAGKRFAFVDRGRVTLKGFSGRFRLYEVSWQDEQT